MALLPGPRKPPQPHEDYGFFGPGSMTWRLWTHPAALTVGFQRSVVIEELDPDLIAAVDQTEAVRSRPRTRYDRTVRYFGLVAIGDTRSAMEASNVLVKVHAKATGIEPLSGNTYDANDPDSQLWIHLTAWHSILYVYEKYGPGKLTESEEAQYWEECAIAAELQTCDPDAVPRSREGIREYFEYMRPRLAGSEAAQSMMDHLLNAKVMLPPLPFWMRPGAWVANRALRMATIASMPRWMRKMGGLRQSRLVDAVITPVMKISFRIAALSPRLQLMALPLLAPSVVEVAAPVLLEVPPKHEETLTPAEARERYGILPPSAEYARFRELVAAKDASRQAGDFEEVLGPVGTRA